MHRLYAISCKIAKWLNTYCVIEVLFPNRNLNAMDRMVRMQWKCNVWNIWPNLYNSINTQWWSQRPKMCIFLFGCVQCVASFLSPPFHLLLIWAPFNCVCLSISYGYDFESFSILYQQITTKRPPELRISRQLAFDGNELHRVSIYRLFRLHVN